MPRKPDSLAAYNKKRDFSRTPEPGGKTVARKGFGYLIQKHEATRLHYDFRLELDGVLKSWAVTKGPSLNPEVKRLAVEVEDHPVAYGTFEGTIPKGEYGGGTVMLWDNGSWEPIGDPHEGLRKGKLEFLLHGQRLKGEWTLVRMRPRGNEKHTNWLLIKHHDEYASDDETDALLEENAISIITGRKMEDIAGGAKPKHQMGKAKTPAPKKKAATKKGKSILPAFIAPELATLSDAMPNGDNWVHELKFDGYRALAYIEDGQAALYTRTGLDWTDKFRSVATALSGLKVKAAVIDGEIVVTDEQGASSFKLLQNALSEGRDNALQYYAFDLLFLNGQDMRALPLMKRKAELAKVLKSAGRGTRLYYSEHYQNQGEGFLRNACNLHLEGVISKRADAPYLSGRGRDWLKVKCHHRQEFVIGGFTLPTKGARGIGALLLGYYEEEELVYAGKVGTGFDNETSARLRKQLEGLIQKHMPFKSVTSIGRRGAQWVSPEIVCEVEFTEWTEDGHLRHPSFQGLREDKPPEGVKRDKAIKPSQAVPRQKATQTRKSGDGEVGSIRISHPERVVFPDAGITKLDLATYYSEVADFILPHIANRPISMLRCPEGTGDACFFQRHIQHAQSEHFFDTGIKVKGRTESYVMIKDVKGLISLVQWGVIEIHPWGCRAIDPDKPDRLIFDLDPDPAVPWERVVAGVKEVRERMKEFGLESFLKTTGGKGLHVVVPIKPEYGWPEIKTFTRAVAQSMASDSPDLYTATVSKEKRRGKIFVDYLRNELTATAVAPYAVRARPGAPVAMPLAWADLKPALKPSSFTIQTVPAYLKRRKADPWKDMMNVKQRLSARILKALAII